MRDFQAKTKADVCFFARNLYIYEKFINQKLLDRFGAELNGLFFLAHIKHGQTVIRSQIRDVILNCYAITGFPAFVL